MLHVFHVQASCAPWGCREPQGVDEGKASNLKAAGTIFIAVVGAGVLGLPYAFAQVLEVTPRAERSYPAKSSCATQWCSVPTV